MSTDLTWRTFCTDLDGTEQLSKAIGRNLKGGEVIELVSDVGGGKTTFVRGLAKGFGSDDAVGSPSFTLSRQYKSAGKTMHHFDFYRLTDPGLLANELAEIVHDPESVTVVEWADIVENVLPSQRVTIRITSTGETSREYEIKYAEKFAYLIPEHS